MRSPSKNLPAVVPMVAEMTPPPIQLNQRVKATQEDDAQFIRNIKQMFLKKRILSAEDVESLVGTVGGEDFLSDRRERVPTIE